MMNRMEIVMKTELKVVEKMKSLLSKPACLSALAVGLSLGLAPGASATSAKLGPSFTKDTLMVAGQQGIKPDTRPVPLVAPKLKYPRHALSIDREGWVIVELDIDAEGKPYNTEIIDSGDSELFEASALEGLEKYRFEPATLGGKPVPVTGQRYKVVYAIQGS